MREQNTKRLVRVVESSSYDESSTHYSCKNLAYENPSKLPLLFYNMFIRSKNGVINVLSMIIALFLAIMLKSGFIAGALITYVLINAADIVYVIATYGDRLESYVLKHNKLELEKTYDVTNYDEFTEVAKRK